MNALVTGATGFMGQYLCAKLRNRGDTIFALSHNGGNLQDGTPTTAIDLSHQLSTEVLDQPLTGADVVYHLAGIAHQQASVSQYDRVNYQGTLALAELAENAGVKHFIYLSSVKAMGARSSAAPRLEDDCLPPEDAYGLSKWRAECALRERYAGSEMAVTIVRPVLVWGPGVKGNVRQLTAAIRRGLPRPPAAGKRSIIGLDDLCELLLLAVDNPAGSVRTLIASGGDYSVQQIYDELRSQLGKSPASTWMPPFLWRFGSLLLDIHSRSSFGSSYDKIFGADLYSSQRAQSTIPWKPGCSLSQICHDALQEGPQ